jgi:hypothetical protein
VQSHYPFAFEREMGCAVDELKAWLPGASGGRAIEWLGDDGAEVAFDAGRVELRWQPLPPRRIALVTLPRLRVRFEAVGVDGDAWHAFMRHFDLYTQRGGG